MRDALRRVSLLVPAFTLLILAGCQNGAVATQHQQSVDNANGRWREMRSKLMLQMAERQFETGDLDQAEKSLGDALAVDARSPQLYVLAGRVAIERGQLEKAYQLFTSAITLHDKLPEAYYYQGLVLQRWQRFEGALTAYQLAYQLRPQDAAYLLAVAETLVNLDRSDEALTLLTGQLTYFDQNAGVRLALAQIYMIQKQYAQAAEFYRQATLLRPDDTRLLEDLALAQLEAGKYDAAIDNLEQLLAKAEYATRTDLMRLLAAGYEASGRMAAAKGIYVKITQKNPADVEGWLKLASQCWSLNDPHGTELAAQRALALAPKKYEGYTMLALVEQQAGHIPQALAHLAKAVELAPDNAQPWLLQGLMLERNGQRAEAVKAYTQALKCAPDDARTKKLLARLTEASAR